MFLSGAADFKLPGDIAELRTESWAEVLKSLRGSGAGLYRGYARRMKKCGPGLLLQAKCGFTFLFLVHP